VGDEAHDFDQVWRELGSVLWRAIVAYAGGRSDIADDAVAEAFARAIERDGQVRDPKAYLYCVAFRVAATELRRPTGAPVEEVVEDVPPLADLGPALRQFSPGQLRGLPPSESVQNPRYRDLDRSS
jgi:DNA-directed RNA polymerase specialized sigma24 family protein